MKINAGGHLYLFLIFSFLQTTAVHNEEKQDVWMNVFVHGIISIRPYITATNFIRFLTDNVTDSPYGQTVSNIRSDPFFYQNQAIQSIGLQPVDLDNHQKGAAASILARTFEKADQINTPISTKNFYYTYGWTALLSRSARYSDAKIFLCELEKEIARLRTLGINPRVRLIGYSHGGTIILKLALVKQLEQLHPNFAINEAYFFGTPIQFDTDYLINDPLFKRVYNIFSRGDHVQKLDFFSCGQFFSDQIFTSHCGFECLPDKLTQVEIRLIRKKGEACKPFTQGQATQPLIFDGKKCIRNIRNVSPGHTELWFFGWTPLNYRKTFPLYPLPIVAFLPFLINAIEPLEKNFCPEKPIIMSIDAHRNSMIIINHAFCPAQVFSLPFIGVENLIALTKEALAYKPDPFLYNWELFNEHIDRAYENALQTLKIKKCKAISCQKSAECEIIYD